MAAVLHNKHKSALLLLGCCWFWWSRVQLAVALQLSDLSIFTPVVPPLLAQGDVLPQLDMRVVPTNPQPVDVKWTLQVTLQSSAPACFQFDANQMTFSESSSQQTLTVHVVQSGDACILQYLATSLVLHVVGQPDQELLPQQNVLSQATIKVLAPPVAYKVDQAEWTGFVLYNDSFDQQPYVASTKLWQQIQHGFTSTACGSVTGRALYFTYVGDRFALTTPWDLNGFDGRIHFFHIYGFRPTQSYDVDGSNLISCEQVDPKEETVFSFFPASGMDASNFSQWTDLKTLPLLNPDQNALAGKFLQYSLALPSQAMHSKTQFRWYQKTHSSFVVAFPYANFFDQWALDDMKLEVRLQWPQYVTSVVTNKDTGLEQVQVFLFSSITGSFVEFAIGDGTHAFPNCDFTRAWSEEEKTKHGRTATLVENGYIHAVACLPPSMQSYPLRIPLIQVHAPKPFIGSSTLDTSKAISFWVVTLQANLDPAQSAFTIRYTLGNGSQMPPSCSFGEVVSGQVTLSSNAVIKAVTCSSHLITSDVLVSTSFAVKPQVPQFQFTPTTTTVTGLFKVTISSPSPAVGLAYLVLRDKTSSSTPSCANAVVAKSVLSIDVRATDQVRAISCCLETACDPSAVSTWGPINVQTVAPVINVVCSHIEPLTTVVTMTPVTDGSFVFYKLGNDVSSLKCSDPTSGTRYQAPVEVKLNANVFAVTCLDGFLQSDATQVQITVDTCCAGLDAYLHTSCASKLLFQDTFAAKCDAQNTFTPIANDWTLVTTQWDGDQVNGGVNAQNVHCAMDADLNKKVLVLEAHGDAYQGSTPVGQHRYYDDVSKTYQVASRVTSDQFTEWNFPGINSVPCNRQGCEARRVGAAIATALQVNDGIMTMRIKPCNAFGATTELWWSPYEDKSANNILDYLPLWRAALGQQRTSPYTSSWVHNEFAALGFDSRYHQVAFQWNAARGTANLYVDGELVSKQTSSTVTTNKGSLFVGVWFPNAWAGEPLFTSCGSLIDQVQIFDSEVTGNRWCDFDNVQLQLDCTSDTDCIDWMNEQCLMPLHEAICVTPPNQVLNHDVGGVVVGNETLVPVENQEPTPSLGTCQFRLASHSRTKPFAWSFYEL